MAYDEGLAARVADLLADEPALRRTAMFGGLAFLIAGNLAVAVGAEDLLVRVGGDAATLTGSTPARPAVMGQRTMRNWVEVPAAALADDAALGEWVGRGAAFARSLPPK